MAGLSSTGFVAKTLLEILADVEARQRAAFDPNVDVSAESPLGQINAIMADRLAELWEVAQALYSAFDPDKAEGAAQDTICAITGTVREPARASTVTLTCTGTNGTSLTAGRVASVTSTGARFATTEAATLTTLMSWAALTAYVVGDRRTNSSRSYVCITAGTSAASGGPTTTASDITDGSVHWQYLGEGAAAADVAAESEDTGPIAGAAGTIATIETPVGGWSSVTNLLDADPGADVEGDAALRLRREDELVGSSRATADAIRARILAVDDVESCHVFQNTTMTTDADGVPAKAVEILVRGGDDDEILAAVWASAPAGIETYGSTSGTTPDAEGNDQTVAFSRPTERTIYVAIHVTAYAAEYPVDGDDQIKAAIVAFGDAFPVGKDVTASAIAAQAFQVDGVLDVTACYIGTSASPVTSTTIVCTSRQLAVFDTSRVTVTVVSGTP